MPKENKKASSAKKAANARKRSLAAKKGWQTRRRNIAKRKRAAALRRKRTYVIYIRSSPSKAPPQRNELRLILKGPKRATKNQALRAAKQWTSQGTLPKGWSTKEVRKIKKSKGRSHK